MRCQVRRARMDSAAAKESRMAEAGVMTLDHDPGPDRAAARVDDIATVAAEPIGVADGGRILVGTASWTDPTMTAAGVFYPNGADTAEQPLTSFATSFPIL